MEDKLYLSEHSFALCRDSSLITRNDPCWAGAGTRLLGRSIVDASTEPLETRSVDRLRVQIYRDRAAMGAAAAGEVATAMREALARQPVVRMIFAAAPSQNELLDALATMPDLDWSRITVFQLDEYLGLPPDAPASFGRYLRDRLFDRVQPGSVQLIDGDADPGSEAGAMPTCWPWRHWTSSVWGSARMGTWPSTIRRPTSTTRIW